MDPKLNPLRPVGDAASLCEDEADWRDNRGDRHLFVYDPEEDCLDDDLGDD